MHDLIQIKEKFKLILFKYLSRSAHAVWNNGLRASGPFGLTSLTDEPSDLMVPSAHLFWNSSLVS